MRLLPLALLVVVSACHRPAPKTTSRPAPPPAAADDVPDYSQYVRQGVSYFAVGNEPSWGLIIQSDRRMHLRTPTDTLSVPTPSPIVSANGERTYEGRNRGNSIRVNLRPARYTDNMSGQQFAYTANVTVKKGRGPVRTYSGGATALNQLMLLGENWRIVSLNGKTTPAQGRQQPFIEFQPSANRVLGSGGCNRFSGTFRADNQLIKFSPVVATKMACANEVNTFETELFRALTGTLTYSIERGHLTLSRDGKAVLIAKRRD
ncbi:protein of unknown function DUF306, MetA and HslJ [Fibrella aestuarina BUZ 2]|uniref:DUF306 domain-containing protein n=1 Tax=Fibrella aestuarina BUZ 2 TaxID=1166018 RepID=I0K5P8_9BACT|nr:META domain-containing protein [Fibrella aestuarina]CCG99451.1 protein of unknown function DUF306, MetA and HslJ [Fibrella aestuarina BUZ 2]